MFRMWGPVWPGADEVKMDAKHVVGIGAVGGNWLQVQADELQRVLKTLLVGTQRHASHGGGGQRVLRLGRQMHVREERRLAANAENGRRASPPPLRTAQICLIVPPCHDCRPNPSAGALRPTLKL